jgi:hypothetical protein
MRSAPSAVRLAGLFLVLTASRVPVAAPGPNVDSAGGGPRRAAIARIPVTAPKPAGSEIDVLARRTLTQALRERWLELPRERPLLLVARDAEVASPRVLPDPPVEPIAIVTPDALATLTKEVGPIIKIEVSIDFHPGEATVSVMTTKSVTALCCGGRRVTYRKSASGWDVVSMTHIRI